MGVDPDGQGWLTRPGWGHPGSSDPSAQVLISACPLCLALNQPDVHRNRRTDLAEKADTAMYDGDEDRIEAAEQLAEHDRHAAAGAFSAIAGDREVGDEVRLSAAERLVDVNSDEAAPACLAIAGDREVGDEVRLSAAERLVDVNPDEAARACLAIAGDREVGDEVRLSAAELISTSTRTRPPGPAWPSPATERSATRSACPRPS